MKELKKKFESASKSHQFKFTPTYAQVTQKMVKNSEAAVQPDPEANLISFDQIVKQDSGVTGVKVEDHHKLGGGLDDLANLPQ